MYEAAFVWWYRYCSLHVMRSFIVLWSSGAGRLGNKRWLLADLTHNDWTDRVVWSNGSLSWRWWFLHHHFTVFFVPEQFVHMMQSGMNSWWIECTSWQVWSGRMICGWLIYSMAWPFPVSFRYHFGITAQTLLLASFDKENIWNIWKWIFAQGRQYFLRVCDVRDKVNTIPPYTYLHFILPEQSLRGVLASGKFRNFPSVCLIHDTSQTLHLWIFQSAKFRGSISCVCGHMSNRQDWRKAEMKDFVGRWGTVLKNNNKLQILNCLAIVWELFECSS